MILQNRIHEILNLYNYYDVAIITDEKGIVEYFYNNRPDLNPITEEEMLGRHILKSCLNITEADSTVAYVLKTGKAVSDMYQEQVTFKGDTLYCYCSTMPIRDGDQTIGTVEIGKYIDMFPKDVQNSKEAKQKSDMREISLSEMTTKPEGMLYRIEDIKGSSERMRKLKYKISCVANTDSTVLIYGETGSGKELVAESIHSEGNRKNKKFVAQNCAAIPPTLLESILFGTEKGSFTGAESRIGIIESAQGGTLFLDEINTMDINTQSKILKAIEEKKIMRVGGTKPIPVDVRVIAAVNVNPRTCVENKTLRDDLYYRLRVVELKVPPLRERKEDIPELVDFFIRYYNQKMGKYVNGLSHTLYEEFMRYDWPGNVRELRNSIECGFNMAVTPVLELNDVYPGQHAAAFAARNDMTETGNDNENLDACTLAELLRHKEQELIHHVCSEARNLSEAARILGISRQGLAKKLQEAKNAESN